MTTVGVLQSAFLWGYGATQVVGGVAADALGARACALAWRSGASPSPQARPARCPRSRWPPWSPRARCSAPRAGAIRPRGRRRSRRVRPPGQEKAPRSPPCSPPSTAGARSAWRSPAASSPPGAGRPCSRRSGGGVAWAVAGFALLPAAAKARTPTGAREAERKRKSPRRGNGEKDERFRSRNSRARRRPVRRARLVPHVRELRFLSAPVLVAGVHGA